MREPRTRVGLICWVAARGLVSNRQETAVRVVVGLVAVLVAMFGATMYPTAQARSQHTADAIIPVVPPDARSAGVLVAQSEDYFDGEPIQVRTLARVGDASGPAVIEGVRVPPVGDQVVSPRLAELLRADDVLAERYPGPVAGTIGDAQLQGPRDLVVWRTVEPGEMPSGSGWFDAGSTRSNTDVATFIPTELRYASSMLIVGFLVPLLALLAVIGTLGAARREQRLASMRLVGLTDREARASAALGAALTAAVSAVVGWACFVALVPVVAPRLPVEDGVWPDDVRLPLVSLLVILAVFPALSVVANWWGLRRLVTSPLGVERRSHASRGTRWPVVVFVVGAVVLACLVTEVVEDRVVRSNLALLASALLMLGLIGVVPLLARGVAAVLARRSRTLPTMIAGRSIHADAARATRSAVGLSLLVCAAGPLLVFFPLIADSAASDLDRLGRLVGDETIVATTGPAEDPVDAAEVRRAGTAALADSGRLQAAVTIDVVPLQSVEPGAQEITVGFVDCADLEQVTAISADDCARGLRVPGVGPDRVTGTFTAYDEVQVGAEGRIEREPIGEAIRVDVRPVESASLDTVYDGLAVSTQVLLPDTTVGDAFATEGFTRLTLATPGAGGLERARTELAAVTDGDVLTVGEMHEIATRTTRDFRSITAGAGLLVVLVAALTTVITAFEQIQRSEPERRLLWMSGADPGVLRRALLVQTLVPSVLALTPAVLISLSLTYELVNLLETARTPVPVTAIVGVALLALVVTLVAGQLVARLAPTNNLAPTE